MKIISRLRFPVQKQLYRALALFVGSILASPLEATSFLYWSESGGVIRRSHTDGTGATTVLTGAANGFGGLAFDPVAGHLYSGDQAALFRANLDGSGRVNLVPAVNQVADVELDLLNQKVYWSEGGGGVNAIYRANFDGSNRETLINEGFNGGLEGIALDVPSGKLYFCHNVNDPGADRIRVMNLDGSGVTTLHNLAGVNPGPHDIEIDVAAGTLDRDAVNDDQIWKSDLVGGAPILVASPFSVNNGMHLDLVSQKIYIGAGSAGIYRLNTDGTGLEFVTASPDPNYCEVLHLDQPVNQPPICNAGAGQTLEAQGNLTLVQLDGSLSSDPDGDSLQFEWSVANGSGALISSPDSVITTGQFPVGPTLVTLTVSDGNGGVSVCDVLITVQDTVPPVVVCTTDRISLWPPNHSIQSVLVVIQASDLVANPQGLSIVCTASSNESDDSTGDGSATGDVNGADGFSAPQPVAVTYNSSLNRFEGTVSLRAERAATGSSRLYSINATVTDTADNLASASCVVVVPHNGKKK